MNPPVEYLDIEDLLRLAGSLLGDPPPVRDLGLLEAAVARPRTSVFGVDAYSDIWTKAASIFQSLVKNHALVDGNKRLAWLATAVFLDINGIAAASASNDEVFEFVMREAASNSEVATIAAELHGLVF